MATSADKTPRQRVPASERRDALIEAAIHEFAQGGLHGTPVDKIARRVGVAQPYVFSLFASKKELFLAAVERAFEKLSELFAEAATEFDPAIALPEADATWTIANAYMDQLEHNRDILLLQHQAYAACGDDEVRTRVRACFDRLAAQVKALSGADDERVDEFFRYGMWINALAAMGATDICEHMEWVRDEFRAPA
ncbi:MAG TPA: TetR/AcrR family transcriptional regulator [Solirubrobacteraceae bacterium]|jgi:AcrR family transcriptional regulator|nr:TetR/AcrR family transcriptional regulator [Solirubrobacteraceae bacterium]